MIPSPVREGPTAIFAPHRQQGYAVSGLKRAVAMRLVRFILAVLLLAGADLAAPPVAHAQLFEPRPPPSYRPPPRRLPGTGDDVNPRRQYVPEQRTARPQRRGFFERLFGLPIDRDEPRRPRRQRDSIFGSPETEQAEPAAPVKKTVPKTIFVAVLGDSLAENLAPGLADALSERPEVGVVREIRPGAGLLKDNEKTWRQVADEILARDPAVAAAVIFLGPYDDPPAKKSKKSAELQTTVPVLNAAPWMDQYAIKVDDIALVFRQKNIPLLWVGLPPVEDEKATADHLFLNDLVRQRVAALGGTFIDVWEGFVDEDEKFTVQGPNIDGRTVRLRTADGVHFTKAGARKIGHSVELELRAYLTPKDSGDAVADLPAFDPGAPTTPGSSRILMLGQAPRTPGAILIPPTLSGAENKTEFNPGIIAGAEGSAPLPDAAQTKADESAIVTGAATTPKPGRADDFAWPQAGVN